MSAPRPSCRRLRTATVLLVNLARMWHRTIGGRPRAVRVGTVEGKRTLSDLHRPAWPDLRSWLDTFRTGNSGQSWTPHLRPVRESVPVRVHTTVCGCRCGHSVATGRKFVNLSHYDRARGLSPSEVEELVARFRKGVPKARLAREYGVGLTTVKRMIRKQAESENNRQLLVVLDPEPASSRSCSSRSAQCDRIEIKREGDQS